MTFIGSRNACLLSICMLVIDMTSLWHIHHRISTITMPSVSQIRRQGRDASLLDLIINGPGHIAIGLMLASLLTHHLC